MAAISEDTKERLQQELQEVFYRFTDATINQDKLNDPGTTPEQAANHINEGMRAWYDAVTELFGCRSAE